MHQRQHFGNPTGGTSFPGIQVVVNNFMAITHTRAKFEQNFFNNYPSIGQHFFLTLLLSTGVENSTERPCSPFNIGHFSAICELLDPRIKTCAIHTRTTIPFDHFAIYSTRLNLFNHWKTNNGSMFNACAFFESRRTTLGVTDE